MKSIRPSVFFITLIVITFLVTPAGALNVWVEKFPPFGYEENNKITGLSTEVLEYIMQDSGIKPDKWTIAPWARAYSETLENQNTILYTVVRTPERESLFYWIGPVADRNIYVYKLKARKDISINSIEDLKKYKVGVVRMVAAAEICKEKGIPVEEVTEDEFNLKKLQLGRIDVAIILDYTVSYLSKKNGISRSVFSPAYSFDNSKKYYIVLRKDSDPKIVEKMQASFNKLKKNGGLKRIQIKYLK